MKFTSPVSNVNDNEWSIEFLRGCAAFMVMYTHYYPLAGIDRGLLSFFFTGVDLFFVMSGFVFAPYFFNKEIQIGPFFIRRIFRIYPLYFISLCAYVMLRHFNDSGTDHFFKHLFFLHTLESKEVAFYFNPVFWSLPPEIEFYLAIPLLRFFFRGKKLIFLLVIVSLIIHLLLVGNADSKNQISGIMLFHLPGLLVEFSLGILAWFLVTAQPSLTWRIFLTIFGAVLWLILAEIFKAGGDAAIDVSWWLHGNMGMWAAIAYTFLLVGFVGLITKPYTFLRKFSIFFGSISFGIYLFHNLMPVVFNFLKIWISSEQYIIFCACATIIFSWILNRFYEDPLRQIGRDLAKFVEQIHTKSQR